MNRPRRPRPAYLRPVADTYSQVAVHQPWCDPAEHAGNSCRSTPIALRFGHRGTDPVNVSSACLQLVTTGDRGTVGRLTLNADVFDLEVDQVAALGSGFDSLLLTITGLQHEGAARAAKTVAIAETRPHPQLAGV